jgi:hypothetical protein
MGWDEGGDLAHYLVRGMLYSRLAVFIVEWG